jgi:alanine-glyoxylate transaminase / serine-glyoxylate transaminase / serine-pyruvate transaminase
MKGRKLLMIPGPIEFEPEVLSTLGKPTTSHVAPDFIESFGSALEQMKQVWMCPSGQPFIIAGSGTLAMDIAGSNLIEQGDNALVVSSGYFGERYADILKRYGANVDMLKHEVGKAVTPDEIESALKSKKYKLLTVTHVDTSTAVKVNPQPIGALGKKYDVLTILDGVCSVGGEEIKQEEWGLDVVLTASQKAIGVPPGLALLVVSPKAMEVWKTRKTPVGNYYADWNNWLSIMQAYEARKPSYFGTPAVNLVSALETSLKIILKEGMDKRVARHTLIASAFRAAIKALNLKMLPENDVVSANTLSAVYYPQGVVAADFLREMGNAGLIIAGGLLKDAATSYFRVGHMGSVNASDILGTIGAVETALKKCNYAFEPNAGLAAAQKVLLG